MNRLSEYQQIVWKGVLVGLLIGIIIGIQIHGWNWLIFVESTVGCIIGGVTTFLLVLFFAFVHFKIRVYYQRNPQV